MCNLGWSWPLSILNLPDIIYTSEIGRKLLQDCFLQLIKTPNMNNKNNIIDSCIFFPTLNDFVTKVEISS